MSNTHLSPKHKYGSHKACAKRRGIDFTLTFEEWMSIWEASGKWDLRGSGKGKYCMCRIGDTGPYAVGNVFIELFEVNSSQANKGRIITEEEKEKIRSKMAGVEKSESHKENIRQSRIGKSSGTKGKKPWNYGMRGRKYKTKNNSEGALS